MIDFFETSVRINQDRRFFTFIGEDGFESDFTYRQARVISAALARRLMASGLRAGDLIALDLPNTPEFVFFLLAAAYSGLTVVMLEHDSPDSEKIARRLEVERSGRKIALTVDALLSSRLLAGTRALTDEADLVRLVHGGSRRGRAIMGENQDLIDDTVHFAERAAHIFDRDSTAYIMFAGGRGEASDGKRDKLKAVPLAWSHVLDAAALTNECLTDGAGRLWQERLPFNSFSMSGSVRSQDIEPVSIWQCVLPLSKIDGFQCMLRSIVAKEPFRLYEAFDPEQILHDLERCKITHIAVSDSMLQDMLTVEEWRSDAVPGISSRLKRYRCLLLVGRTASPRTIRRAFDLGCRIFTTFGLPQTSGTVAVIPVTSEYRGGLRPLEGYDYHIVDADKDGYGRLAISGPGVFDGYLNTRTAFTVDRFFITETRAYYEDGLLFIRKRTDNMFVSAGQNIYPVEIADILRHVSGVGRVHVFGVPDSRCGKVPIAVIERTDGSLTPKYVEETTRQWLSGVNVPISIFVFDQLPQTSYGKLDRKAIEAVFNA